LTPSNGRANRFENTPRNEIPRTERIKMIPTKKKNLLPLENVEFMVYGINHPYNRALLTNSWKVAAKQQKN
jgi:hypothetical protein